jgi:hypothetical protein
MTPSVWGLRSTADKFSAVCMVITNATGSLMLMQARA